MVINIILYKNISKTFVVVAVLASVEVTNVVEYARWGHQCSSAMSGHQYQCSSVPMSGHQCGGVRVVLLRLNVDGRILMSLWCTVTVYHKTQS